MELKERDRWAMILLLAVVSIAFIWISWPFYPAILWAVIVAIVAMPTYRKLVYDKPRRRTLYALLFTIGILAIIILPAIGIMGILVDQAVDIVTSVQRGEIDIQAIGNSINDAMPGWLKGILQRNGMGTIEESLQSSWTPIAGFLR